MFHEAVSGSVIREVGSLPLLLGKEMDPGEAFRDARKGRVGGWGSSSRKGKWAQDPRVHLRARGLKRMGRVCQRGRERP